MQDFDSLISFFVVSHAVKPGTPGIERCVTVDNPDGLLSQERHIKLRPDDYLAYTKLRDAVEEYRKADAVPTVPVPGNSANSEEIPAQVPPTVSSPSEEIKNVRVEMAWLSSSGEMTKLFRQYAGIDPRNDVLPSKKLEQEILVEVDNIINGNAKYKPYRDYVMEHTAGLIGACIYRLQESVFKRFQSSLNDYARKFSIDYPDGIESKFSIDYPGGIEKFCRKFFRCSVSATFKKWLKASIITDNVDSLVTTYDMNWGCSSVCKEPVGAQMFTLCELARIARINNGKLLEPLVKIRCVNGTLSTTLLQSHFRVLYGKVDLAIHVGIRQMMHGSFFCTGSPITEDNRIAKYNALYYEAGNLFMKRLGELPGEYKAMLEESAKAYDEKRDSSYNKQCSIKPLALVHSLVRHSLSEAARILMEEGIEKILPM